MLEFNSGDTEWMTIATFTGMRMQEFLHGPIPANTFEPLAITVLFELAVFMLVWNRIPAAYKQQIRTALNKIDKA